ncbi:LysM peptidoglycan-binding domain-containing protein [bacterium CPR1]|nr:LysM peptidoglycan-binding domain-containing protein [bacterium CPR1]
MRVDAWKKGPDDSLERILTRQGYTPEEIYRKDSQGRSLIQRVAGVNELADPNLVRPGQSLVVPVKDHPQPQGNGAAPQVAQAQANPEGASRVTVDAWGKGSNDSLERILVNQGYSLREIHTRDRDGKSLLDRVAGDNGLESPDSVRAGRELVVPSRRRQERGEQEQRREQPARDPKPASEALKPPAAEPAIEALKPPAAEPAIEPPRPPAAEPAIEPPRPPAAEPTIEPPKPPAAEPASEPPKPPVAEPSSEAPRPPADGEATLEMGLMLDGMRQNRLTRDEFKALNGAANRYEEMRAAYGQDGFSPDELRDLGRFEEQYGKMYARFFEHDRSRIRIEANQTDDPRVQQRLRLTEEGGALYDRYKTGEITLDEAAGLLMVQRSQARELGRTRGGL